MSDNVDEANELADLFIAESLKNHKPHSHPPAEECIECGVELDDFRARYGICIDCQRQIERDEKLRKMRGDY